MKTYGLIAEFESPGLLMRAAEALRAAGYREYDCHSPFPVHGMDEAMGLSHSPVGVIVGIFAVFGAIAGMTLQWWVTTIEYPLVISGKPFFSFQAYIIITFALFVLFGAFAAVFGMLGLNKLPRWHHPLFDAEHFRKASDDGFFVSVEARDRLFDETATRNLLESLGGRNIEAVRGE